MMKTVSCAEACGCDENLLSFNEALNLGMVALLAQSYSAYAHIRILFGFCLSGPMSFVLDGGCTIDKIVARHKSRLSAKPGFDESHFWNVTFDF